MKNWILWLLCLAGIALSAVFTGSWIFAALLLILLLLLVSSAISGFLGKKNLFCCFSLPKAAEQEGEFHGKLILSNESIWPVFLGKGEIFWKNSFTGEKGRIPVSFSLGGRKKTEIGFQARSSWCGCIHFQTSKWKCSDFFGMVSRAKKGNAEACTVIMPGKQNMDFSFLTREGFDMESFRYSGNRPGDDPGETFDIREYREGDSIRQIHWKLTGKMDRLMIREKSFPVDDTVLILADAFLEEKNPVIAQTLAEVFSAVLESFMEQGISCQAGVYDESTKHFYIEKIRTQEDYENILYLFLRHGGEGKSPRTITEYLQNPGPQNFANYIYITGTLEDSMLRQLSSRGEVTIVGCGMAAPQNGGETITWKYGSQSKNRQKNITDSCPVSCWKLR